MLIAGPPVKLTCKATRTPCISCGPDSPCDNAVSLEEDDFVIENQTDRGQAVWVAFLSDGRRVYQDDRRLRRKPESAWQRLGQLIEAKGLWLTGLAVKFRDHWVDDLPRNQSGYFFCKSCLAFLGNHTIQQCYLLGWLDQDGQVRVRRYSVPELELMDEELRSKSECAGGLLRGGPAQV